MQVRLLDGMTEGDRVWRSTLNGSLYRFVNKGGWQFRTPTLGDTWWPVKAGAPTLVVYARAGEYFEDVSSEASDDEPPGS